MYCFGSDIQPAEVDIAQTRQVTVEWNMNFINLLLVLRFFVISYDLP